MIDRHLFTDKPSTAEKFCDIALAVVLGLCLTGGLLAYFGILW